MGLVKLTASFLTKLRVLKSLENLLLIGSGRLWRQWVKRIHPNYRGFLKIEEANSQILMFDIVNSEVKVPKNHYHLFVPYFSLIRSPKHPKVANISMLKSVSVSYGAFRK